MSFEAAGEDVNEAFGGEAALNFNYSSGVAACRTYIRSFVLCNQQSSHLEYLIVTSRSQFERQEPNNLLLLRAPA